MGPDPRYFVDEYPSQPHFGVTMMKARPIKRLAQVDNDYGAIAPLGDHDRRIHLGYRCYLKLTDDGLIAFGLPFTSPELQAQKDAIVGKVAVFLDPDCINHVTIVAEGFSEPFLGELTWTGMQDMTLAEFQSVALAARAEEPSETEKFEARLNRIRRERYNQMNFIATERKTGRSFMTIKEAELKAAVIASGVQTSNYQVVEKAVNAGFIASEVVSTGRRIVGDGFQPPIEGTVKRSRDLGKIVLNKPNTSGKLS